MNAQDFAVLLLAYNLDEPAVIPQNRGLAVPHERELAHLDLVARLLRLLFRQADGTNLRLAVCRIRNAIFPNLLRGLACNVGYRDDAFHHGRVRQLWHARYDVANGVQTFFCRFHVLADVNKSALQLRFRLFQAAILRHRHASHGQQKLFRLQRLLFPILVCKCDGHAFRIFLHALHFAARLYLNVFLAEGLIEFR